MIRRFRNRALKRLYEDDNPRSLNPDHLDKIKRVLARLDRASRPEHMDLPGWRLHPLKGDLAGFWSVTIQANWRIIFRSKKTPPQMWTIWIIIEGVRHEYEKSSASWSVGASRLS